MTKPPNPFDVPDEEEAPIVYFPSRTMKVFKFLVTRDYPIAIGTVIYKDCLAVVLAHDAAEARVLAKKFFQTYDDPYAKRDIDSAWLDFVEPQEFPLDTPCTIGVVLG